MPDSHAKSHASPGAAMERGGRRGRARRDDAGLGAVARRLRRGQALQDRHDAAAVRRRRDQSARRPWSACRWRSTASTNRAASTGRPVELIVADYESKPDVGRRKAEKLVGEDKIDAHVGGVLSNVCLACMPVWEENKIVNMVGVCLDTTMTTSKCSRYTFRPFDYAPAQAVAFAPYLVNKLGKKWHIAYADYAWGQSTRDAYAEQIKKLGGEVVGTTGIPLGTADMTPFLSKISGDFDGLFGIFFGKDGVTIGNQAYDLGLTKKYKFAGDGAVAEFDQPAGARQQDRGVRRHQPLCAAARSAARHARRTRSSSTRRVRPAEGGRPVRHACPTAMSNRISRR